MIVDSELLIKILEYTRNKIKIEMKYCRGKKYNELTGYLRLIDEILYEGKKVTIE